MFFCLLPCEIMNNLNLTKYIKTKTKKEKHVGGVCALWTVHVTPPNIQKYSFVMLLEALSCPLSYEVIHVSFGGLVSY